MYVFTIFIAADSAIVTKCFYLLYTFCLLVLSFLHNISFVPLCLSWRSIFYSSNISFLGLLINIHMIVFSYFRLVFLYLFFYPYWILKCWFWCFLSSSSLLCPWIHHFVCKININNLSNFHPSLPSPPTRCLLELITHNIILYLKTLDTIGNCQRPVFSLVVSQHMHNL